MSGGRSDLIFLRDFIVHAADGSRSGSPIPGLISHNNNNLLRR